MPPTVEAWNLNLDYQGNPIWGLLSGLQGN